jgi:hypothetical protein
MGQIGPIPSTVEAALDGYLAERRRDREAYRYDAG